MKVGVLEKSLPMELELVDKEKGLYNIYAPGGIDYKWILDTISNPPEDCKWLLVYCEDEPERYASIIEKIYNKHNTGVEKYFRVEKDGHIFFMIDLGRKNGKFKK